MKKKLERMLALLVTAVLLAGSLAACGTAQQVAAPSDSEPAASAQAEAKDTGFVPKLDTDAAVTLDIAGFFGNFEALDQVVNNFNEYYPNVTINYESNSGSKLAEYVKNNPQVDIFMTDDTNLRYPDWTDYYVRGNCVDLTAAGVDVSDVQEELLASSTFDGALLRLPMGLNLTGIVANKTLLRKEGLDTPTTWQEFLDTCAALKEKGYTPIQGPEESIYADLVYAMGMDAIGCAPDLLAALNSGDEEAVEKLEPVFARVQTLLDKGYIDPEVNASYPTDNYDGAILNFFEGDVPFWVCTTEKVSGMKKRESKSESFTANPFEYQFLFAPLGDGGVYQYIEPWVGFSVNKDSDDYDYAVEFVRFLAQEDQLNTIAEVKGVPAVSKHAPDDRYTALGSVEKVEQYYINDGTLLNHMKDFFRLEAESLGQGRTATPEDAARSYVQRCAETAAEMAAAQ